MHDINKNAKIPAHSSPSLKTGASCADRCEVDLRIAVGVLIRA